MEWFDIKYLFFRKHYIRRRGEASNRERVRARQRYSRASDSEARAPREQGDREGRPYHTRIDVISVVWWGVGLPYRRELKLPRSVTLSTFAPLSVNSAKDQRSEASRCRASQTLRGVYTE